MIHVTWNSTPGKTKQRWKNKTKQNKNTNKQTIKQKQKQKQKQKKTKKKKQTNKQTHLVFLIYFTPKTQRILECHYHTRWLKENKFTFLGAIFHQHNKHFISVNDIVLVVSLLKRVLKIIILFSNYSYLIKFMKIIFVQDLVYQWMDMNTGQ